MNYSIGIDSNRRSYHAISEFNLVWSQRGDPSAGSVFRRVALPKLIYFSSSIFSLLKIILVGLYLTLFLSGSAFGQTQKHSLQIANLLTDKLNDGWRATGSPQILTVEQSSVLPDGDVYAEYGLVLLANRQYTDGKNKVVIEIFQMKFASGAYGLLSYNRGNLTTKRQEFQIGRYLISISTQNDKTSSYDSIIRSFKERISDEGELSPLPSHLPKQGRIAYSEKYIIGPQALSRTPEFPNLKDVINFEGGTEAVVAKYQNADGQMNLILVEYHTPQLATDGYTQFQEYFDQFSELKKNQSLLKRIGNYVVLANNIKDPIAAESLLGQIKYNPKVYWEGDKLSDIPVAFRPPDPVAIEEASHTALVLIRTFYWVGIMLLGAVFFGVITGGSVFYLKRYRRRKLGLEDVFSDAGGSVRLNLDDYLLQPAETTFAKIEKESKRK